MAALGIGSNTNSDSGTTGGNGSFTQSEVDLLARIISAEARGEEYAGQVAVGAVIMNRIEHPGFQIHWRVLFINPELFHASMTAV